MIIYNSGTNGYYVGESDHLQLGLPILCKSTKRVGVANGGTSKATNVTRLPFNNLPPKAAQADTFIDFPTSLMSIGKTADDGTISIFTKDGVTVVKEEDVLLKCKGQPILIGVHAEHGRYQIPLMQQHGQWQPLKPTKKAQQAIETTNNVYNLPSTEHAI